MREAKIIMNLKVGDSVMVITGSEKGKLGKIKQILKSSNKVVVEGLNMTTKHRKPTTRDESGMIVQQEAPIHISNVMICDSNDVPSKIRIVKVGKNKERFSKKTGEKIV
uniref:Large ribosomal subunit protein uL24c n=1 Tax=Aureoumbra lagunensis TaxID=44058 RepID=C6KIV2_9STRA|nr:50S ribosomal protein L24 [Aureoumbra lagunensis]ACS36908.1 50S ribosomal protein L24 [Aureoumbra lagunensis]